MHRRDETVCILQEIVTWLPSSAQLNSASFNESLLIVSGLRDPAVETVSLFLDCEMSRRTGQSIEKVLYRLISINLNYRARSLTRKLVCLSYFRSLCTSPFTNFQTKIFTSGSKFSVNQRATKVELLTA